MKKKSLKEAIEEHIASGKHLIPPDSWKFTTDCPNRIWARLSSSDPLRFRHS